MIEDIIKKDIETLYDSFKKPSDIDKLYTMWEILDYSSKNNMFDEGFYRYYLIKTLSIPDNGGLFILCVKEITRGICKFDALSLGELIKDRIIFNLSLNKQENAILLLNYALQGGAFFNREIIRKIIEVLSLNDDGSMMSKNIENEKIFLDNMLPKK